ncbi:hypothetical protein AYJ54_34660 [Bradyrhizobium centrolobii]|uniref:DUF3551 domain-containing protein n=1 Tax=Bradyrhizobium centrolobii TaxID=1505087 RepID=A0A176Y6M1_9BRAD|nr:DUF3551 domain-containing protein [Bradyrhizobium centrolobii]OAE97719.1 hypothetical protein AYJ54_34660 [Bradyrhizobium centrolobii]
MRIAKSAGATTELFARAPDDSRDDSGGLHMSKLALLAAAIIMTLSAMGAATPGNAQNLPWCSKFKGMTNCMYATRQQCRASVSGRHGTCVQNHRSM